MGNLKITPGQIKALWDYLDSIYEVACITHFCHSPEGEILVILDANGDSKMVGTPWIYSEGVAVEDTSLPYFADADLDDDVDLDDPFWTFLGVDYSDFSEDDDDYDDYDDQQRYHNAVADDLFWTFLGADDEMRYREDSE